MKRRNFIKNAGLAGAGITILNFPVFGRNAPSNKVILAVMGVNSRGSFLAESFSKFPNVEVAYICEVEDNAAKKGLEALKNAARKPTVVKDIRRLVEQTDFDALVIAAPDHWHTPAAILGSSHGKHVYVEKPCGHNPHEGELVSAAYRKYGKHIQMGDQRRSFPSLSGLCSKCAMAPLVRPTWQRPGTPTTGNLLVTDKKLQCRQHSTLSCGRGRRRARDYRDNLVHYNWHWFWNWGTGEACNNGTHEIDCCRWFLGVDYPTKVTSAGGRYAFNDDWQTPDTQVAAFEFGDKGTITWEGRSCNNYPVEGSGRGFIIYGTGGTLVNRGGGDYKIFDTGNKLVKEEKSEVEADPANPVSASGNLDLYHLENFIKTIRGEATLTAPVDEASKSVLLCHLANIAQRTGEVLHCDPANGHILNSKEAMKLWSRNYEKGWEPVV